MRKGHHRSFRQSQGFRRGVLEPRHLGMAPGLRLSAWVVAEWAASRRTNWMSWKI
jgi:hypothetical protein